MLWLQTDKKHQKLAESHKVNKVELTKNMYLNKYYDIL